jgi:thiol-disulfide isomerase/thioredoxin
VTGLVVLVVVLAAATAFGLARRRTDGALKGTPAVSGAERLTSAELGGPLGERATLVQFSSAFCAPCRATKQILDRVAGQVDGVAHYEIDAESHLDLVRRLDVRRTPTTLVLDASGVVRKRAAGQPRHADVVASLGEVL